MKKIMHVLATICKVYVRLLVWGAKFALKTFLILLPIPCLIGAWPVWILLIEIAVVIAVLIYKGVKKQKKTA